MAQQLLEQIREHPDEDPNLMLSPEGTILFKGLVYVPQRLRRQIIKDIHTPPAHGHRGINPTTERIERSFYIPHLRKKVRQFITECEDCARNKAARHAPYGKLQPITPPDRP